MKEENLTDFVIFSGKPVAITILFLCAAILIVAVLFSGMPLNHDSALLLQCGRLITDGSIPYIDHVEISLYMNQYIHVPPVLLSNLLSINVSGIFTAGVLIFVLYSCFAVLLLVRELKCFHSRAGMALVASSVLILSMQAYSDGDFGQREHLFLLAYLPFIFVRFSRYKDISVSTLQAVIAGFFMGVMILCKPSFLIMVVLIEVWMRLRSGKTKTLNKPEMLTIYSIAFLFAVHLILLPESLHSPFFTRWLPYVAEHYSSYNETFYRLISKNLMLWPVLIGGIAAGLFSMTKTRSANRFLLETLILAVVIGVILYFLQHKGWIYHLFPAFGFAVVLWAVVAVILQEKYRSTRTTGNLAGIALLFCPLIICLLIAGKSFQLADSHYTDMDDYLELIEVYSNPDQRISFISTSVYPKYPTLVYADRLPGTRFMFTFPIAFANHNTASDDSSEFGYRSPEECTDDERRFLMELGMDIQNNKPALVFIQATEQCQGCPPGFRVDEYLINIGWLDEYMSTYRLLFTRNGYRTYQLIMSGN